ncbi:peptidylprolyl isomerase [Parabacteroides sp. PF5-6]|uniref:peptidylprolyl isomerase n=1 Tax=Parabacteroides sp. PF5-6 TaxID=1742403 RepID=UPI0024052750|nr:peptidylprolyl isomerase [Parabacteroides sp. PF5-6]MDF9831597.1 peptidyl-prolyl cis-trans isomerase SurA [Parabacteroides sp. PF5-6]
MKGKILRKNIVLLLCLCLFFTGKAKNLPDSVIMTVAGKEVPLSEFIFIAQKNGEADFSSMKSLEEYAELFTNFKLKVADAEAKGLDKTRAFSSELAMYKGQLIGSYLSDKEGEDKAMRLIYDRGNEVLELSYILFKMPPGQALLNDTIAPYQSAIAVCDRLRKGENLDVLGKQLAGENPAAVQYEYVPVLLPLTASKALENGLYSLPTGEISAPIRTGRGYYVAQIHKRVPNPGKVRVAHILVAFQDTTEQAKAEALVKIQGVYEKLQGGADFATLAKEYSDDPGSKINGGELKAFGPGEMVLPFEKASFALQTPGELSGLIESRFGYHIIKLIEKQPRPSYESEKRGLMEVMSKGEYNFELYQAFDDRMRQAYSFVFYPEAYQELVALTGEYFPADPQFYEKAKEMHKTLFTLEDEKFAQGEFAYYMATQPFSTKTYGPDFMQEIFDLFIRELTTNAERAKIEEKYPEYKFLLQEYRDGILLFEISNDKVWSKPVEEQPALEAAWLKELKQKYPVVINKKALKRLKN